MTTISYPLGSQVRITGTFTNELTSALADPSTVTLYVLSPNQATAAQHTTSSGVVRDSLGVYHYDLTLDTPGVWYRAWAGTGAIIAAEQDIEIVVANSKLR